MDIGDALFSNGFGVDETDLKGVKTSGKPDPDLLDFNSLLVNDNGSDDDGDEAFIASRLRGANRKSSNLHGKTVKKGGGFQAMGRSRSRVGCKAPSNMSYQASIPTF